MMHKRQAISPLPEAAERVVGVMISPIVGHLKRFLTLTGDTTMSGEVRVGVASEVNMGIERTATITIKTEGGSGDALDTMITIVQATSPPVLRLISSNKEVIAHDRITVKNIIFDVGGWCYGLGSFRGGR